jgi:energy-coupling factor transporter ATP-binding protein EcfA2
MNFLVNDSSCHSNTKSTDNTAATDFVALVGSPNCGKTTLFNRLTGMSASVVNYPGATVDYMVAPLNKTWGTGLKGGRYPRYLQSFSKVARRTSCRKSFV